MSKKKKDWKTEKERLLRLDREVRRKEYRRQDFMPLEKIPTWREENITSDKEDVELTGGGGAGGLSDKVSLYKGDITILEVDAIVNAANSSLLGGGGVDGCIHKAAGSCLYEECLSLKGCETGKAKITCGYDLPAKYVIHTVGPVARGHVGPTESSDLASCYQNSLRLMEEHNLRTVAFPCISTGIYGFPNDPAADIALKTVKEWIQQNPDKITRVIFCVFLENDFAIYKKKMSDFFKDDTPPLSKSATKEGGENNEEENPAGDEPNQEQQDEEKESQDKDEDMAVEDGKKDSEEKGLDTENTEDKADKKEPEAKMEEEDTANSAKDKEGVSSSNAGDEDEMVDSVEPSASAASVQPKDSAKKNE